MATTLSSFPGQFPQVTKMPSGQKNLISLHRFEANGGATVGNSYTIGGGGGSGVSYNHNGYTKFDKSYYSDWNAQTFGGYFYKKSGGDSNWGWGTDKSYMVSFKNDTTAGGTGGQLVDQSDHGGSNNGHRFGATANYTQLTWGLFNGSGTTITLYSNTNYVNLADGKVHTALYVCDATNDHKLYIDGRLHDSSSTNITCGTGYDGYFDADAYSGGINGFSGWMDEFIVFNKALSAKEAYAYGGALLV